MATTAAELYDEDLYAWTQQQAQALREHFKADNPVDVELLAEEIEDLGKSDLPVVAKHCPYDWNAIWHRGVFAEGGIDLSGGEGQVPKTRRQKGSA